MSELRFKVAFRFPVRELTGKKCHEVYPYFVQKLGEADEVWASEQPKDVVDWFCYEVPEGKDLPFAAFVRGIGAEGEPDPWGIEVVVAEESLTTGWNKGLHMEVLEGKGFCPAVIKEHLVEMGFDPDDIDGGKVYAYTWDTGAEEPLTFL